MDRNCILYFLAPLHYTEIKYFTDRGQIRKILCSSGGKNELQRWRTVDTVEIVEEENYCLLIKEHKIY